MFQNYGHASRQANFPISKKSPPPPSAKSWPRRNAPDVIGLLVIRVGVKYSTCTWYLYLSTYLSVLDVLEYLVYGNAKVLVLDQKVLGTYK